MVTIILDSDFGFPLSSIVAIAFQCIIVGFVAGGGKRGKMFSKEFMEKHFKEEHLEAFGTQPPEGGYPDMGNGRYAEKLSYKDWFDFNNGQRAHYNFIEQVASTLFLILVAGLSLPWLAGAFGWAYFAGRVLYTFGYLKAGPKGRLVGVLLQDVSLLALLVLAIIAVVRVWKGDNEL